MKKGSISLYEWCLRNNERGQQLLGEWTGTDEDGNVVDINNISSGSSKKVVWHCLMCSNNWKSNINNRTASNNNCPNCYRNNRNNIARLSKLKTVNSLKEWCTNNEYGSIIQREFTGVSDNNNHYNINDISYGSGIRLKWVCSICNKEYFTAVVNRTSRSSGCPYCSHKKIVRGVNDLYTFLIKNSKEYILQDWIGLDIDNNEINIHNISAYSRKVMQWKCSKCGNIYTSTVISRMQSITGCKSCANLNRSIANKNTKLCTGNNDLYTWCKNNSFGETIKKQFIGLDEFDKKIDIHNIAAYSTQRVKWMCNKCHKIFVTKVQDRTHYYSGCPNCNIIGTSFSEQYLFNILKQIFNNAENRFKVPNRIATFHNSKVEYDIAIDLRSYKFKYGALFIEYSPEVWHSKKIENSMFKRELCNKYNIRFIEIIDSRSRKSEYTDNMIIDDIENKGHKLKIEKLNRIADYILKSLNHSILEVDTELAEQNALSKMGKINNN